MPPKSIDGVSNIAARDSQALSSPKGVTKGEWLVGKTHLMVIKPIPVRMPMIENNCQKSSTRNS